MAKKPSTVDLTARSQTTATWIASIVAGIALVVSVFSLYESHEARVSTVRDEILLRARRPMGDQPVGIQKLSGEWHHGSIAAPWDLLISNTGNSTASITSYEVLQVAGEGGEIMYSGLDRGLFSPEDNQPVAMPIILEAGKSIRLVAMVGLSPGKRAYAAITEFMSGNQMTQSIASIEKALAKKGIDIYDNPVAQLTAAGEVTGWRVEQQGNEQVFLFKVHTARGSDANEVSSWYDLKRY